MKCKTVALMTGALMLMMAGGVGCKSLPGRHISTETTAGPLSPDSPASGSNVVAAHRISQEDPVEALVSTNHVFRLRAVRALEEQRRQLISKLMAILQSTNSVKVKFDAVMVLGAYRASEAVPFLVDHLEWDDLADGTRDNVFSLESREGVRELEGPVKYALMDIGLPAIPALLDRLKETQDARIRSRCVWIAACIEGTDVLQSSLEELLRNSTDQKGRELHQSALQDLETMKPQK
jgi:HEAT repeat protein